MGTRSRSLLLLPVGPRRRYSPLPSPLARSPPRQQRRKVNQKARRPLRLARLAVVLVPPAPVLVGQIAPAEVRPRLRRHDTELIQRVDALRRHRAQMSPVVPEVEEAGEMLPPGQ